MNEKYNKLSKLSKSIIGNYVIRNSKEEKDKFIELLSNNLEKYELPYYVENLKGKNKNIIVGDILNAKYIFTAHYDTPKAMFLPNICTPKNKIFYWFYQILVVLLICSIGVGLGFILKAITKIDLMILVGFYIALFAFLFQIRCGIKNKNNFNDNTSGIVTLIEILERINDNQKKDVAFVFFDNEEKGLKGSKEFYKEHKDLIRFKTIINFDCVGEGDNILLMYKNVNPELLDNLRAFKSETKFIEILDGKKCIYNSDQKNFPIHIGCMAGKKKKIIGTYISKIHTKFDKTLEQENVLLLRDIFCEATKK